MDDETSTWLSKMTLASGKILIPEEEVRFVAGNLTNYEHRIREERIDKSEIQYLESVPSSGPERGKSITYIVAPELVPEMNRKFQWFSGRLRSSHRGMFTCEFGPEFNHTNITLVLSTHVSFWVPEVN